MDMKIGSYFIALFILMTVIHPAKGSQYLKYCSRSLENYSQEDIAAIVELAYGESVTEVVNILGEPYQRVLSWIFQHEKMLAERNGKKLGGPGATAFLSQTYRDGAIDFAIQPGVGIKTAANQTDISYSTLFNSIIRQYGSFADAKRVARENRDRVFSDEIKEQAVALVEERSESRRYLSTATHDVAEQLDIPHAYVYSWYHEKHGFGRVYR